jgi:diguanylate cyclase (GGDEF)-like protein
MMPKKQLGYATGYLVLLIVLALFSATTLAFEKSTDLLQSKQHYIDSRILALLPLLEKAPNIVTLKIKPLNRVFSSFNAAEQRLLLQVSAQLAYKKQQYAQALLFMKQAYALDEHISKEQLNQPVFAKAHLLMADIYVALDEYDNAFLEKREYVKKYLDYTQQSKEEMITTLSKKYETENKSKHNELLASQNKLKQLQIKGVDAERNMQQVNIYIVLAVLVVFILLLYHQFKISKKLTLVTKTDSLTKLLNRQALFDMGEKLISNSKNTSLNVIMIDIDNFKKINDDYGHVVGDKVLKQLALLGCEVMRSRDVFARLGGEEFVAVLPELSIDEAKAIAERIKEKMASQDLSTLGIKRSVTLSLGLASLELLPENTHFDALLHAADVAMYQAKEQGRDQVVVYQGV